jgi:hypothetical protein
VQEGYGPHRFTGVGERGGEGGGGGGGGGSPVFCLTDKIARVEKRGVRGGKSGKAFGFAKERLKSEVVKKLQHLCAIVFHTAFKAYVDDAKSHLAALFVSSNSLSKSGPSARRERVPMTPKIPASSSSVHCAPCSNRPMARPICRRGEKMC